MYYVDGICIYGIPYEYLVGLAVWVALGWWALVWLLKTRRASKSAVQRMRWVNLGLSVWTFLAGCTLIEIYFAFLFNQSDSFNQSNVSHAWHKRHSQQNAQGFRDTKPLTEPANGRRTLWFIGDSFTFGHGVPRLADRFSDGVARDLEERRPGTVLVHNVAEAGINTPQVRSLAESLFRRNLHPDVLVYVICLNDIEPYSADPHARYTNIGMRRAPFPLFSHTYFFNMLWFRVKQATQPEVRGYFDDLITAYKGRPRIRMLSDIDRLHASCQAVGTELRIVLFPFLNNLGPEYPYAEAHKLLLEHCEKAHISAMDLRAALEPHVNEGLVVNRFDAHPNERAHALAAEAMEAGVLKDFFEPAGEGESRRQGEGEMKK